MSLGECSAGIDLYAQGAGGGAPAWSPTDDPPDAWWKVDVGVQTDVDGVFQWDDQSGNGKHWTQITGSQKPELISSAFGNGMDAVTGDAIDDRLLQAADITSAPAFTIFMARVSGATTNTYMMGNSTAGSAVSNTTTERRIRIAGLNTLVASTGVALGAEVIECFGRKANNDLFWYHNGAEVTNAGPPNQAGVWALYTLCSRAGANFVNTQFGEIIVYLSDKTSLFDDASAYLNTRFGVY